MTKEKKTNKFFDAIVEIVTTYFANYEGLYSTQAAFYFIISAVPLLMLMLSLIRYIIPVNLRSIIDVLDSNLPESFSYYVIRVIREIYTQSSIPMISITAITSLWAASKGTYALSLGLKTIYRTLPTKMSAKRTILNRAFSLLDTLMLIAILGFSIVSLVFDKTFANVLSNILPDRLDIVLYIVKVSNLSSIVVFTVAFTIIYKVFSRTKLPIYKHFIGAFIAGVAWVSFSFLYSLYFDNFSSFSVTYGALAAVVFLMLWLKTCMMIMLFGAQINMYLYIRKKEDVD